MENSHYEDPRVTALYDVAEGTRSDLDVYAELIGELGARSVLDVGCGTGSLALRLADRGLVVTALDSARAMLNEACRKPGADSVRWLHGTAANLPVMQVDLAVMTGNTAQEIVEPSDWSETLAGVRAALRPGGHLVFETRDPARRQWEEWTCEDSWSRQDVRGLGVIESWYNLLDVELPLVTFRETTLLPDGTTLTDNSTLRFRSRPEVEGQLEHHGY